MLDETDYSKPSQKKHQKKQLENWKKCFTWRKSKDKFINIKVINADNLSGPGPVEVPIQMDWESFIAYFDSPQDETVYQIAVYTDREYINTLEIELRKFNESRMSKDKRRDY